MTSVVLMDEEFMNSRLAAKRERMKERGENVGLARVHPDEFMATMRTNVLDFSALVEEAGGLTEDELQELLEYAAESYGLPSNALVDEARELLANPKHSN